VLSTSFDFQLRQGYNNYQHDSSTPEKLAIVARAGRFNSTFLPDQGCQIR